MDHQSWAYDFACEQTLEELQVLFNEAGPWPWQLRDSYIYGDYLNTRPTTNLHVRIHEYALGGLGEASNGLHDKGLTALLCTKNSNPAAKSEADRTLRDLLSLAKSTSIIDIEPYD